MKTRLVCVISALVALVAGFAATVARPAGGLGPLVVVTKSGPVRGRSWAGMRSFLGIPFAAPPVGRLRWRAPQPPPGWRGVRDAIAFGSACPQTASLLAVPSTNEDCLFLNVFSPPTATAADDLPVMVWIHGGGLVSGDASTYLPGGLVDRGVVVVTINYRLGALGFLSHPALTAESPDRPSGNYGLLDQQAALRWVQENIASFGGDPSDVTLFGQSAGGLSVHAQLASPAASGLFQRAIVQSGGYSGSQPSLREAARDGRAFAARVGCVTQTAACLRRVPVARLLADQVSFDVTPVVDGRVLTRPIAVAFTSGRFNRVPVIEGSNRDEFRFFLAMNELAGSPPLTAAGYRAALAAQLGVTPSRAAAIAARYPLSAYPSPSLALAAAATDADYACTARAASRALSQFVPTYEYEFDDSSAPRFWSGPAASFPLGAFHAAELGYLFALRGSPVPLTGGHLQLARAVRDLWTSFAKIGKPGDDWRPYSNMADKVESLAPPRPAAMSGFAGQHKCAFWSRTSG